MSLNPRITDLGSKVRLDWTPDLNGEGYAFTVDGQRVSRTFKPDASSTTFQKPDSEPHRYGVQLLDNVGAVEEAIFPPVDPDPEPGNLPFPVTALADPIVLVGAYADFRLPASTVGKDVIVDFKGREGAVGHYALILDNAGGPPRHMHVVNGHTRCTKPHEGSGYRHGGLRVQTEAARVDVLDWFDQRRDVAGATGTDGLGIASETYTDWTVQRCLFEGQDDSTTPTAHVDVIQIQGPLRSIRIGLLSGDLSGVRPPNHAGKGFQLAQEPWNEDPGNPFTAELEKVDIECLGNPATGARPGVSMVQEFRDGPSVKFGQECYWSCSDAIRTAFGDSFPVTIYPHLRTSTDYGVVSGTRPNRKLSWATKPQAGFTGEFKERPVGQPRFVTRAMLGYA